MSQANPTVFVTQENSMLNYAPAEQFGSVAFLTSREASPVAGSLTNASIVEELRSKLRNFDFDFDHLCPSGSPTVNGLAFFILAESASRESPRPKSLRVLRWSNRDRVYQPVVFKL